MATASLLPLEVQFTFMKILIHQQLQLSGHQKTVLCLCELNSNQLISGSEDKTIKIWNIANKSCEGTITGNYERVDSIVHLTDNLIAAGTRNNIRVYDNQKKKNFSFSDMRKEFVL